MKVTIDQIRKEAESFLNATAFCMVANVMFAGKIREMQWVPALIMAPIVALIPKIGLKVTEKIVYRNVDPEIRKDKVAFEKYLEENTHRIQLFSFAILTFFGTVAASHKALTLMNREVKFMTITTITLFDLVPLLASEKWKYVKFSTLRSTCALSKNLCVSLLKGISPVRD